MRIAIGSDRRGLEYKTRLVEYLKSNGYEVEDVGTNQNIPCDYPIFAEKVGHLVASGACSYGVLICATGIGMMIAANKIHGIRCGMGYTDETAELMRQHNDANIIAFGQSQMDYVDVERRMRIFLNSEFAGQYHISRIQQISDLEDHKAIKQSAIVDPTWGQ